MSVRGMAVAAGVPASTVSRAESGEGSLRVAQLVAIAAAAGLRLALVDAEGVEQLAMRSDGVRDGAGRRLPAHVDVRHSDEANPLGEWRRDRPVPWFSFRRATPVGDDDHPAAGPRDSPTARAEDRRAQARARARREVRLQRAIRSLLVQEGLAEPVPDPLADCSCPPGCEELLVSDDDEAQRHPHVDGCPCRCDVH